MAKILVSEEEIDQITTRIANEIKRDYENSGKKLILLGILKGSVAFMGDLMKKISLPLEIEFMKLSSYGTGTKSSGRVNILLDIYRRDLEQCDVLIVEDIVDTGRTLSYLLEYLKLKGASSVKVCTMLDKPSRRETPLVPDYCGKQIENEFVVGYGLDFAEQYRALPYIGVLKPELYNHN